MFFNVNCCGGGDGSIVAGAGLNYSYKEQLTPNVYFEKPVYMKCVDIALAPSGATATAPHGIADLDKVVSLDGVYFGGGGTKIYGMDNPHVTSYVDGPNLHVHSSVGSGNNVPAIVTIFYTKTTD